MATEPIQIGDAHNVVAELSLSRDALEWLAYQCPSGDGFTRDLFDALARIDREAEEEAEDIREFGRPAIALQIDERGNPYFRAYVTHTP